MSNFVNMARVPELRKRIFFALALLAVYRLGVHVPTPGVDATALSEFFASQSNTLLGVFNFFSGGALERFSIFALGIMPYISASIIFQLLTPVIEPLEKLQKEGEMGRKKITQYTRYLTVVLSCIQGIGIASFLQAQQAPSGAALVLNPGWWFKFQTVVTLAAGTSFLMWLGEQITERGIGNGISLIIFAGIVAGFPSAVRNTFTMFQEGQMSGMLVFALLIFMLAVTYGIVYFEQAYRRIPVQHAKRQVGRKMYQAQNTSLPLKVNMAGVIPPIFASSILAFPSTLLMFSNAPWLQRFVSQHLNFNGWIMNTLQAILIIFFCFFYVAVQFNPEDVAENLKKSGGYVPGIRPGKSTAKYIETVLERITLIGAIYVAAVCVVPVMLQNQAAVSFYFGGTSLLIVVGVALDTMSQIQAHLVSHDYTGMMNQSGSGGSGRSSKKLKSRRVAG